MNVESANVDCGMIGTVILEYLAAERLNLQLVAARSNIMTLGT